MKWPADRKFTDAQGKILDHWRGPMSVLEPLLALSPAQFTALQQLIAAYIESQQDEETDPGAALNLALPIDEEPLFSEDWVISFKNSVSAGRRVPMAFFEPVGRSLISTTNLAGQASVTIAVPAGFTDVEVAFYGVDPSASTNPRIAFSENGGAALLTQDYNIFTESFGQSGTTTTSVISVSTLSSGAVTGTCRIPDYLSAGPKLTQDFGMLPTNVVAFVGSRYMGGSIAPINAITFDVSSGTFSAGSVKLWGIP